MRVLTVNAGSSSVKLAVLDADDATIANTEVERWDGRDLAPLEAFVSDATADGDRLDAVVHRVVHGGEAFTAPVVVDDEVVAALEGLVPLAPLHQPPALAAIAACRRLLPELPAVACFDTAFHATMPSAAATYALPAEWRRLGVRRFGFHGLSHAWATRRAGELLDADPAGLRLVTAHLGAGASLCAVDGGRSVATTMGFTPLEGLVMVTRSGDVDPGALLWLQSEHELTADELADGLEHRSGLAGLAELDGGSGDLRDVLEAADAGHAPAHLAVDVYVHRLRAGIAAMAAAMGGLDALVFTGAIGERSARVRDATCARLGFLGVGERVTTLVVSSREDRQMASEARRLLRP